MAAKTKVPKICPVCGVENTLVKEGKYYHCTDRECGSSFVGAYLENKAKALKAASQIEAEG